MSTTGFAGRIRQWGVRQIVWAGILGGLTLLVIGTGIVGAVDTVSHVGLWITVELVALIFATLIYLLIEHPPTKMLVVAQGAYREAVRQPLWWFLLFFFLFFMFLSAFLPYFTMRDYGEQHKISEDLKMMKVVQLDAILLPAVLLVLFTASMSISDEIEGRTAITLLSKPVSRREYLLGKYLGILFAASLMIAILAVFMGWTINFKINLDKQQRFADPVEIQVMQSALDFLPSFLTMTLRYTLLVFAELHALAPGVILLFCQVMILTSIAVALATRLPMVVNLVVCLGVFFMGRLTPILVHKADETDNQIVRFMAQFFQTLLPGLNYYNVESAIVAEYDVPWSGYVLPAATHGLIYTGIAILFGLVLFEDRDLA